GVAPGTHPAAHRHRRIVWRLAVEDAAHVELVGFHRQRVTRGLLHCPDVRQGCHRAAASAVTSRATNASARSHASSLSPPKVSSLSSTGRPASKSAACTFAHWMRVLCLWTPPISTSFAPASRARARSSDGSLLAEHGAAPHCGVTMRNWPLRARSLRNASEN